MYKIQNRKDSKALRIALISAFLLLLSEWGLYEKLNISQEKIKHTIDFILFAITVFGIINNPTNKNNI